MMEEPQTRALIFTSLKVKLKWPRSFSTPSILAVLASEPEKLPCATIPITLLPDQETGCRTDYSCLET